MENHFEKYKEREIWQKVFEYSGMSLEKISHSEPSATFNIENFEIIYEIVTAFTPSQQQKIYKGEHIDK